MQTVNELEKKYVEKCNRLLSISKNYKKSLDKSIANKLRQLAETQVDIDYLETEIKEKQAGIDEYEAGSIHYEN